MSREQIVELGGMTLWFHADHQIVHHQMSGYPGEENLKNVLMRGLEVLRERKAVKWLSDDRAGGALPKSFHEWGEAVWAPAVIAAGWKYWALLPPEEVLGRMNMQPIIDLYNERGVEVRIFKDPAEGLAWLQGL